MLRTIKELLRYRTLVGYLVLLDLRVRYRASVLGFLWTLLNPLMLMAVMWVVFSRFGRIQEENYALFLLAGLMAWLFFQQSVERALNAIVNNRGLIHRIYIPKIVFPVSVVASNFVNLIFFVCAYVIIAFASGTPPGVYAVWLPAVMAMLFLLSLGGALMICALNVFFRDFTHLTSVFLRAMFYLTPVLYPPDLLGPTVGAALKLNPVYYPVMAIRDVLYYNRTPSIEMWWNGMGFAVGFFVLGLAIFTSTEKKFIYYA